MTNQILIRHNRNWGLNENRVKVLLDKFLKQKGYKNSEVGVIFVGRKKAKDLNIKYRGKTYIPQVLGFPLSKVADSDGMIRLGDIVVCTQKLKYEARKIEKSAVDLVLAKWLEHGVDNLLK